jgi:hypothetical protein
VVLNANQMRVQFKKATPTEPTPNYGSIIADPDPIVPLSEDHRKQAIEIFERLSQPEPEPEAEPEVKDDKKGGKKGAKDDKKGAKDAKGRPSAADPKAGKSDPKAEAKAAAEEAAAALEVPAVPEVPIIPSINKAKMLTMLKEMGFAASFIDDYNLERAINSMYKGPADIELPAVLDFVQRWQAPAFEYGERLRLYVEREQAEKMIELIARGCPVNTADGERRNVLHMACEYDKPKMIQKLRSIAGADLQVNAKDRYGWTPLYTAAYFGNGQCAKLLLDYGANHAFKNDLGKTALHAAASQGRTAVCDTLLKAGASMTSTCKNGMTPLHEAAFNKHRSLFEILYYNKTSKRGIADALGNLAEDYILTDAEKEEFIAGAEQKAAQLAAQEAAAEAARAHAEANAEKKKAREEPPEDAKKGGKGKPEKAKGKKK